MEREQEIRDAIHRDLDGDLSAEERARLGRDLAAHPEFQAMHDELSSLQSGLRALRDEPFPDEAQRELRRAIAASSRRQRTARWAAVAAVAVLSVGAWWSLRPTGPTADETVDAQLAAEQLVLVFQLTNDAIDRSAEVAVEGVAKSDLRPALQRIPMLFQTRTPGEGG